MAVSAASVLQIFGEFRGGREKPNLKRAKFVALFWGRTGGKGGFFRGENRWKREIFLRKNRWKREKFFWYFLCGKHLFWEPVLSSEIVVGFTPFFFRDWWKKGANYFEVRIYLINNSRVDRSFNGRLDFVGLGFPNQKNTDTQLKIHQKTAACSPPAKRKTTSELSLVENKSAVFS